MKMKAPFPWFGGKSRVADLVWERFGPVPNYVEPFAGSLAVLLARPSAPRIETVNDADCYLSNFWRAVKAAPDEVARWANWPVNEADLHARHKWLIDQVAFRERMKTEPEYFDAQIAGWWVWGICCWIGSGWCSRPDWSGRISAISSSRGLHKKRPAVDGAHRGKGVHSVVRQVPDLGGDSGAAGRGVHASGIKDKELAIVDWMRSLQDRLRAVRVCCGDWTRVLGYSPTECIGVSAIFLDPPYSERAERRKELYAVDDLQVAHLVRDWAIANGDNPALRIAMCGYEGEHDMPESWSCVPWKANGGYGNRVKGTARANAGRERIWFSPHCLKAEAFLL